MKRKLVNTVLALAVAVFTGGSFSSCKDYEEDKLADIKGELIDENAELRDLLKDQQEALQTLEENLRNEIEAAKCGCTQETMTKLEELLELFQDSEGNVTSLDELVTEIIKNNTTVSSIDAFIGEWPEGATLANELQQIRNEINRVYVNLSDELTRIDGDLATLRNEVRSNTTWIEAFQTQYQEDNAEIQGKIADLTEKCNNLQASIEAIEVAYKEYTKEAIATLKGDIYTKLGDVRNDFADADQVLQDQIDDINELLDDLKPQVEQNTNDIADLKAKVGDIEDALSKLVTGIIVQGTENPVFGSISLPLDVRSNVLMSYCGVNAAGDRYFPSLRAGAETEASYNLENVISSQEITMLQSLGMEPLHINANETLFEEEEGNAGTVYLTVNPNTVNFEGVPVKLVNSQDAESKITLSLLKPSDKVLTFGYTRAANNNAFYEAKATLKAADINDVKINIEPGLKSEMKNILTSLQDRKKNVDLPNLVVKIYNQFNGILPANGVKTTWTDKLTGEHSIYSQYNVAATAFKPLSYKFLENQDLGKLPTINPINSIDLGDFEGFNFKVDFEPIKLNDKISINFSDIKLNGDDLEITVEVNKYEVRDGELVVVGTEPLTVEGLDDFIAKLQDQLNDQISGDNGWGATIEQQINEQLDKIIAEVNNQIAKMVDSINSQLGDVNGLIDQMNGIEDKVNSYVDKVNSYITRVNTWVERINSYLTNANHYLQVTMLYENANGKFGQLSNSKKLPSTIKVGGNDAVIYPTSFTAELVAPAYKKFIAVTNVYSKDFKESALEGDATCMEALKAANSSELMNKVVKGTTRAVKFPAPAAKFENYVYEIAYSALDYNGISSTRKFYVRAVK